MLSWTEKIRRAGEEIMRHESDPFLEKVTSIIRGMSEISTHALLDLIGLPNTTATRGASPRRCNRSGSSRSSRGGSCRLVTATQ